MATGSIQFESYLAQNTKSLSLKQSFHDIMHLSLQIQTLDYHVYHDIYYDLPKSRKLFEFYR